ncbi:MAG: cytochrome c [Candidatus Eremiobacteraeota bacterium]|nr:cytochrome c [Candidatus Eremiobacteraeota bacterium]
MLRFVYGIVFALAFVVAAAFAGVWVGVLRSGADSKPSELERWAAGRSLKATIRREDVAYVNPLEPSDANLLAGVKLYGANCAVCHGSSDGKSSTLAKGFYIEAPQLATDGVEDDPEKVTYWKLDHGIRFTAMPAFGKSLSSEQLWQLTMFLSRMDKLPPAPAAAWKALPSASRSAS